MFDDGGGGGDDDADDDDLSKSLGNYKIFFFCGLYWAILGSSWGYAGVLCKHWFWCTQPVFIYEDISVFFDFFPVATSGFCVGIRPREQN